jgi:hypothetical protein
MGTRHLYWILTNPSFAVWFINARFFSEILKLPKDSQLGQDDLAKDERFLVVDRIEPVARHHFRAELLPEQCHRLVSSYVLHRPS